MKYIEQIKTVVLFVLVILSVTLTFSIWSYRPSYDTIEKPKTVDIVMDDKKIRKKLLSRIN
ncbi:two-component system activity regulator YycH [Kurthia senegalensis]|uniref:two-component system activity regulator YycH n=1 Tax=Kurthia senegalensis TaxID=1033740 RepID=UPI000289B2F4|nr:two-component system activity regulator YycH [Kurthia senegalensis]